MADEVPALPKIEHNCRPVLLAMAAGLLTRHVYERTMAAGAVKQDDEGIEGSLGDLVGAPGIASGVLQVHLLY